MYSETEWRSEYIASFGLIQLHCVFEGGGMGAEEGEHEQWSGGVHVVLECELERAWAIQADFTGLHNWNPSVKVCRLVEGVNRQPGCVRYCEGTRSESWVYERLLFIDEARHEMSYRMEKNRFRFQDGIRGYVARIQVSHKASIPHQHASNVN